HYKYTIEDMKSLADMAKEYDARLITTEKDFMRVPKSFHKMVIDWPVEIVFEDELTLRQILHPIVHKLGG
ncbi:MAG TPA: tetraacyldisaccharide 4'-kinase, partial [Hellea balneolensis]|nr:tetraacyldisaccharide 4'-kinase [Hellea balneolensis]